MTDKTPLKPPDGYKTWIDYAIATMDVRTLHLESCDTDTILQGDDFRQAAQDEYDELVAALEGWIVKDEVGCTADQYDNKRINSPCRACEWGKFCELVYRAKGETT